MHLEKYKLVSFLSAKKPGLLPSPKTMFQKCWASATKPQAALWFALNFGRLSKLTEKQVLFLFLCLVFNGKSGGYVSNHLLNQPRCEWSSELRG